MMQGSTTSRVGMLRSLINQSRTSHRQLISTRSYNRQQQQQHPSSSSSSSCWIAAVGGFVIFQLYDNRTNTRTTLEERRPPKKEKGRAQAPRDKREGKPAPKSGKNIHAEIATKLGETLQRGTPLYKSTLHALQWQRDNYLMGPDYADKRKAVREIRPNFLFLPRINYVKSDPKAFGNIQLAHLGSWFIPSPAVKKALMPIVLDQPRGSLYKPAQRGIVGLIDSQQSNMDALVKQSVLDLLEQERLRHLVMNSTKGYIADRNQKRE